ncbi:MAG: hypothetical protein QGI45_15260 [Myxococcota bacterium]|jgi:hypothetical protein|nr:hypothetical protein [Myxococcota bacterium]
MPSTAKAQSMTPNLAIPWFTCLRIFSVCVVVHLRTLLDANTYAYIFFAILFGHYLLAFVYAQNRVRHVLKTPRTYLPSVLFISACVGMQVLDFDPLVVVYFGIHHALSENYMTLHKSLHKRQLIINKVALNFALYTLLMRHDLLIAEEFVQHIIFVTLLLSLMHLKCLAEVKKENPQSNLQDCFLFEIAGIVCTLIFFNTYVAFEDIVLYHLILWSIYPLFTPKLQQHTAARQRYMGTTIVVTLFFLAFTPIHDYFSFFTMQDWIDQSYYWAYWHITTSLMLSRMNPIWLRKLFEPGALNGTPTAAPT